MKFRRLGWVAGVLVGCSGWLVAADLDISAALISDSVKLGDWIEYEISVKNKDTAPTTVRELKFGQGFMDFFISAPVMGKDEAGDAKRFRFTRILGNPASPTQPAEVTLPGGEALTARIKIPALLPEKMTIIAVLWERVEVKPVTVAIEGSGKAGLLFETDAGEMTARLAPEVAPNTAFNIASLVKEGFYDGLIFHRIVKDFMIQGGDPEGTGTGGPGFSLPAEFNPMKHKKGVLSMARSQHPHSAGSQFFLMHGTSPALDGQYTGFGQLIKGEEVLDKLAATPTKLNAQGNEQSTPLEAPVMKTVKLVILPE